MAALVGLFRNKTRIQRQEIPGGSTKFVSTLWWLVAYVHMFVCCCTCMACVRAYVREKVMFEVYGGESESMSDQYGSFFCF